MLRLELQTVITGKGLLSIWMKIIMAILLSEIPLILRSEKKEALFKLKLKEYCHEFVF
jgi:hypothetical protein